MEKIKYKLKKGYGSHRMHGKTYVSGDVVKTNAEELRGALDKFEQLEPTPSLPEPVAGMTVVETDGGYDVVNDVSGKTLNDEPLHQHEAEAIGTIADDGEPMTPETKKNGSPDDKA